MAASGGGGSKNIEAGRAFVRIGANLKPLDVALKQIPKKLTAVGKQIAGIGAGLFAGGGAVLAGITALSKAFVDAGSDATDMAARLNTSVETLTALGYAASLAGGDISDVETALGKMQAKIADEAQKGNQFFAGLLGKDIDGQLAAIADHVAAIENPTLQSAAAMEIFGTKLGRKMLPFLKDGAAGLEAMRRAAGKDGAIITSEEADRADRIGDSFTRIWTVIKSIGRGLGSAFLPTVEAAENFAERMSQIGASVRRFISQNSELFRTMAIVAVGVTAGGAALTAFGLALATLGTILSSVIGAVTFLATPLGAVSAILVGFTAATITSIAKAGAFNDVINLLGDTFGIVWGGIKDAVMAGDLELAFQIISEGIQVAWEDLTNSLTDIWEKFKERLSFSIESIGDEITSMFERAYETVKRGLAGGDGGSDDLSDTAQWMKDNNIQVHKGGSVSAGSGGGDFGGGDINKSEAGRRLDALREAARMKALTAEILAGLAAAREPFDMGGGAALLNAPALFSQTKGMFAGAGLGSSLSVGDERNLLERTAKATEKTNEILEDKKGMAWG